jgi:hypothetical protein
MVVQLYTLYTSLVTRWDKLEVFGKSDTSHTFGSSMWGWHVARSQNRTTLCFCCFIFALNALSHFSVIWDVMFLGFQSIGNFFMSMLLKYHGLEAFPINISFSNSPVIKSKQNCHPFFAMCSTCTHTHAHVPSHHNLRQCLWELVHQLVFC